MSLPVLWGASKTAMRGQVIAIATLLKKQRAEKLDALQLQLANLECEHQNSIDPIIKVEITREMNEIEEVNDQEISIYSRKVFRRWQ